MGPAAPALRAVQCRRYQPVHETSLLMPMSLVLSASCNRSRLVRGPRLLQVDQDLRKMLVAEDAPKPKKIGVRIWPKAIPQFNVAHQDVVQVGPCSMAPCMQSGHHRQPLGQRTALRMLPAELYRTSISIVHLRPADRHDRSCSITMTQQACSLEAGRRRTSSRFLLCCGSWGRG